MSTSDLSETQPSVTMSGMSVYQDERGAVNGLALSLVFVVLLLVGALAFGVWAYGGRQDYKDNVDAKVAAAVVVAKADEDKVKDAKFAEENKNPLKAYNGPSAYGSVVILYPKTWSGYVRELTSSPFVDGYFSPGVVPDTQAQTSSFALRVEVVSQSYAQTLKQFDAKVKTGKATVQPYALPKVPSVVGSYVGGELETNKSGFMVLLPLRSETLKISTESNQYKADFDNIILPNASFSP